MSSKWELQREISYLENLKEDLDEVIDSLSESTTDINNVQNVLANNYKIDDDSNKSIARAKKLEQDISSEVSYIRTTIKPAIDKKISSNEREIREIEEEEERKRQEAMERAQSYGGWSWWNW